jgi:NAD(P)-dependent dehydrogenase (short-subunit alcohol dehydrogenase family)
MNCFVTGATGFIGRYLVRELLARNSTDQVYVLVRPGSKATFEMLRSWWGEGAQRVVAVVGDLQHAALGVDAAQRAELHGQIDHFFHLAALYDLDAGAAELAEANVQGTRHALELAQAMGARCFNHCSSIAAAGLYRGVFTEDMFEEATGLEHAYFRTKHEAEALVRGQRRIPWRIYRPAMVVGDSRTGHITKVDGPYHVFKALQILRRNLPSWLPTIGFEGGYINLVPVDYVAACMVHLAYITGQDGRCFHLVDPQARRVGEVINLFAKAGHAPLMGLRLDPQLLRLVPREATALLAHLQPLQAILEQLREDLQLPRAVLQFLQMPTRFDNTRSRELLQNTTIQLPVLEDYAWRLWDYWERHLDPDLSLDRSLSGAVRGKRVLITGGTSGIGRAAALKLARAGAKLLIVARNQGKLAAVQAQIASLGGSASVYACDLTDAAACARLVSSVLADHGGVDVLINNAGRSIRRSIEISTSRFHDYERLMQLNYFAAVRLTLALLPSMAAQRSGHVIVISSIGVLSNAPRFSGYVASKAALESFARCASAEYRDQNVHFSVINMPLVRTPMIAPTQAYAQLPTLSPEEAADLIGDAIVHRAPRIMSRLGLVARLLESFAPRIADTINNVAFHMFPDSAAARGEGGREDPPTTEATALASLLRGLHW